MYLQRNRYRTSDQTPHTFAPSSFKRVLSVFGATGCASMIASVAQFCQRLQSDVKIVSAVAGKHVYSKETHRHDFPFDTPLSTMALQRDLLRDLSAILRRLQWRRHRRHSRHHRKTRLHHRPWLQRDLAEPVLRFALQRRGLRRARLQEGRPPATAPTTIWRPCSQPPTSAACM